MFEEKRDAVMAIDCSSKKRFLTVVRFD